jgi:dynactin complex subunit
MAGEIKKLIDIETIYQEGEKTIKNLNIEVEGLKANELRLEDDLTRMADMKKEVDVELATCKTNNTNEGLSYYTWFTRFWSLFRVFFTRKAGE